MDAGARAAKRILAVGGGKGGVGKSLLAANVAIYLATLGKRVVLLDADLSGTNLHAFVGIERPRVTLGDYFAGRVSRVEDVVVETAVAGLGLVSGEGDAGWLTQPRPQPERRVVVEAQRLDVDYLVVDLGPGSGATALDFFLLADVGLLVAAPEPTAIENTYRFLKSAFLRRLPHETSERALSLVGVGAAGRIPAPWDLYEAARAEDGELAATLAEALRRFRPRVVVNQVRTRADLDLGPGIVSASRRRLGVSLDYLGHIEHDDTVWVSIRKRRPLLVENPESRASKGIERVARRILALESTEASGPIALRSWSELTHYETLEIDPAASDEEIRRAYRRVRELFSADSLVVSGLFDRDRLAALHLKIEEAYDTLLDHERRKAYDLALFPDGLPPRRRGAATPPGGTPDAATGGAVSGPVDLPETAEAELARPTPPPPEPVIDADTIFTGPLLRQIREARSIDLHAISFKTKIGIGHLTAIEEEQFDKMPALVYVRGFLTEYARYLRLDVPRVVKSYLSRLQAARGERE